MIDPVTYQVAKGGKVAQLTGMQFALFTILRDQRGNGIVTNEEIYRKLFTARKRRPSPDVVKVMVSKMRRELAPLGYGIASAWGVGYQLSASPAAKAIDTTRVVGGRWTKEKAKELRAMHRAQIPFTEQAARLQVSFNLLARRTRAMGLKILA